MITGMAYFMGFIHGKLTYKECGKLKGPNSSSGSKCVMCLDKMMPIDSLNCGHSFHNKCIKRWLRNNSTCPICRALQNK